MKWHYGKEKFKNNIHQVFENKSLLPDSHSKCVDILVKLIQQTNALYNHVVYSVDIELDLGPRVAVSEPQLGLAGRQVGQTLYQVVEVVTDT